MQSNAEILDEIFLHLTDLAADILALDLMDIASEECLKKYTDPVISAYMRRHHDYINQRTEEIRTLTGFLRTK